MLAIMAKIANAESVRGIDEILRILFIAYIIIYTKMDLSQKFTNVNIAGLAVTDDLRGIATYSFRQCLRYGDSGDLAKAQAFRMLYESIISKTLPELSFMRMPFYSPNEGPRPERDLNMK